MQVITDIDRTAAINELPTAVGLDLIHQHSAPPPTTPPTVHSSLRAPTFRLIPEQRTISISPNSPSQVKAETLTPLLLMMLNSPLQLSSPSPSRRPINFNLLDSSIKTAPPLAEALHTTLLQLTTGRLELIRQPISLTLPAMRSPFPILSTLLQAGPIRRSRSMKIVPTPMQPLISDSQIAMVMHCLPSLFQHCPQLVA